jgi:small subunit ribosomal protein S23
MRKLASQVPSAMSRLLQAQVISTPPLWHTPVNNNPPPILPPRQNARATFTPSSTNPYTDLPVIHQDASREGKTRTHKSKHFRQKKPRPQAIVYEEDRVRRQFFRDFPFEAFRPTSLVEGAEVREGSVQGEAWTSLGQRGGYPAVEEWVLGCGFRG